MSLINVTNDNFDAEVLQQEKALVYFWAPWCGYCKLMSPLIEMVAAANPTFTIAKVNVDDNEDLANRYEIETYPTLLSLRNGEPVDAIIAKATKTQIETLMQ